MIVEPDFPDHWKTTLLIQLLGPGAPIGLLRLWAHCQQRRTDVFDLTAVQLAAIVRIGAKPAAVEKALVEARWIEREGEKIIVRGWRERNAGWLAKVEGGRKGGRRTVEAHGNHLGINSPAIPPIDSEKPEGSMKDASSNLQERRGEERRRELTPTRASAPACAYEALSATAAFIIGLFSGKKNPRARLSREAEAELGRQAAALPLTEEQQAVLTWFYALPERAEDWELSRRYGDADRLAVNLFAAIERAESYRKKTGAVVASVSAGTVPPAPWPAGAQEWLARSYPERAGDYAAWREVPESVRSEFSLQPQK